MSPSYKGARFYKCDLQMGTPVDTQHWAGDTSGTDEQKAQRFVRRCYEERLELIAITDHNFGSRDFIPLVKEYAEKLAADFDYHLVVLPGFEMIANIGKGVHCLCIFDADYPVSEIDHVLTECGLPPGGRFKASGASVASEKNLKEIINIVQKKDQYGNLRGLVICPHVKSEAGIFDNEKTSEWLQQSEFTNPDLLAVEVPKPPEEMSKGFYNLFTNSPQCMPEWKRCRQIACLMSSDAKAYSINEGAKNYIGFRWSWIKLSSLSIEGLRQAFLDPNSRIRLQQENPHSSYAHPKIRSISVKGAEFLEDMRIDFSDNMNTFIGGRGTGKSTIVDYLRLCLGHDRATAYGEEVQRSYENKINTLKNAGAKVTIEVEKEGGVWEFTSLSGNPPAVTHGGNVPKINLFFPSKVLGQKEIFAISEDAKAWRDLIEDVVRSEIDKIRHEIATCASEVNELTTKISKSHELIERKDVLVTERADLEAKINRLGAAQKPLAKWEEVEAQSKFYAEVKTSSEKIIRDLTDLLSIETVAPLPPPNSFDERSGIEVSEFINSEWAKVREKMHKELDGFSRTVLSKISSTDDRWRKIKNEEDEKINSIKLELKEKGIDPEKYMEYKIRREENLNEEAVVARSIREFSALKLKRDGDSQNRGAIHDLFNLWSSRTSLLREAARTIQDALPRTSNGKPFLNIEVTPFADISRFKEIMQKYLTDKRRMSEDDWNTFLDSAFEISRGKTSPFWTLRDWMQEISAGNNPKGFPWSAGDRRTAVLQSWLPHDVLDSLLVADVPEYVRITLFRQDGSEVGHLDGGRLSVGQRCTAILGILLACDTVPILIDQPEDDLDNEFVYRELVPLLRSAKERRQIFLVSHNANIPVNGDSELIVPFQVEDGRGKLKAVGGSVCTGALDAKAVQTAVEEIMEGSEEAFRRRYEKYGF